MTTPEQRLEEMGLSVPELPLDAPVEVERIVEV